LIAARWNRSDGSRTSPNQSSFNNAPAQAPPGSGNADLSVYVTPLVRRMATDNGVDLSTVTGTAARGVELFAASQPVAEAMEGAAAGSVAARFSRAFLEVRTVSNLVGVRDRAGWDIPQATSMLTRAVSAMIPVLVIAP